MGIMDGADPVDRLYGFVGLGPADRRFISRMHFRYLRHSTTTVYSRHSSYWA